MAIGKYRSVDQLPTLPACASDQLVRSFSTKPISEGRKRMPLAFRHPAIQRNMDAEFTVVCLRSSKSVEHRRTQELDTDRGTPVIGDPRIAPDYGNAIKGLIDGFHT